MSVTRFDRVVAARAKLIANLEAGKWAGNEQKLLAVKERLSQLEGSIELLKGATSRRAEAPGSGVTGVSINCGAEE